MMPGDAGLPSRHNIVDASIVIPIFDERENVERCYHAVKDVLDRSALSYEIVFVDDGSSDGSTEIMRRLQEEDSSVQFVRLARNAG